MTLNKTSSFDSGDENVDNDETAFSSNNNNRRDGLMTSAPGALGPSSADMTALDNATLESHLRKHSFMQTFMGVAGNILEWYDFAVFGYLADVLGEVFFPPQAGDTATIESFAVFGGAFLMRPIGGFMLGYMSDTYGRKKALVLSIFLMAFPTFAMGCLPSYEQVGYWAIVGLVFVRLLQGLSVGGQLVSSLVYTLERQPTNRWGYYGSFVMAAANFGTLLGGLAGEGLRSTLTHEQLRTWGWRIPFLSGIIVSIAGFYLRKYGDDDDDSDHHHHKAHTVSSHRAAQIATADSNTTDDSNNSELAGDDDQNHLSDVPINDIDDDNDNDDIITHRTNPLRALCVPRNLRSLLAAAMVASLWAAGFYLSFVWMAIYMANLSVPHAFGINSAALLISVCLFFPYAGHLSDTYGRRRTMTIGGVFMIIASPILVVFIGKGQPWLSLVSQSVLGVGLSFWGSPMLAWLVEAFPAEARTTLVAVGYNLAQAIVGGSAPSIASLLVDKVSVNAPGWILTFLAIVALTGLWVVAPPNTNASNGAYTSTTGSTTGRTMAGDKASLVKQANVDHSIGHNEDDGDEIEMI